jgi:hypothetical protein
MKMFKIKSLSQCRWLTPIILLWRIEVQSQPGQIVRETLSRKTIHRKKKEGGADGVAQGEDPEFKKKKRNLKAGCHASYL